eukprot:3275632-Pleurochrysis_carterae.AAC.2
MQSASNPMRDMNAAMPSVRDIGPEKRRNVVRGRPAGCPASPSTGCASDGVVGVPGVFQGKLVSLK